MIEKSNSLKLSKDLLEDIRVYSEIEKVTMSDFAEDLLKNALSEHMLIRSGGAIMTIINPCIESGSFDDYKQAIDALSVVMAKIYPKGNCIVPLINNLIAYYTQRIYYSTPEDIATFKKNLVIDGTHCESFAKYTK